MSQRITAYLKVTFIPKLHDASESGSIWLPFYKTWDLVWNEICNIWKVWRTLAFHLSDVCIHEDKWHNIQVECCTFTIDSGPISLCWRVCFSIVCIQYVESWLFFTICIYIFLEISSCIKVKPVIVALKHNKSGQMFILFILHIRICFSPLSVSAVKLKLIRNLLPLWKQNMLDNDKNYLSF